MTSPHVLDDPVWHALHGVQAHLGSIHGRAAAFDPEVSLFAGLAGTGEADWADLRDLIGTGRVAVLLDREAAGGFRRTFEVVCHQMIAENWQPVADPEAVVLGPADVPEMLDLTGRTKPGPFEARTIEMGRYVGFRVDGQLVAMAGERMHPPGFTEISAVCTDPEFTGRGYARRLIATVGAGIVARGEVPFLHVALDNPARHLYAALGFTVRRDITVRAILDPPRS